MAFMAAWGGQVECSRTSSVQAWFLNGQQRATPRFLLNCWGRPRHRHTDTQHTHSDYSVELLRKATAQTHRHSIHTATILLNCWGRPRHRHTDIQHTHSDYSVKLLRKATAQTHSIHTAYTQQLLSCVCCVSSVCLCRELQKAHMHTCECMHAPSVCMHTTQQLPLSYCIMNPQSLNPASYSSITLLPLNFWRRLRKLLGCLLYIRTYVYKLHLMRVLIVATSSPNEGDAIAAWMQAAHFWSISVLGVKQSDISRITLAFNLCSSPVSPSFYLLGPLNCYSLLVLFCVPLCCSSLLLAALLTHVFIDQCYNLVFQITPTS
jgi:hypothetical protein